MYHGNFLEGLGGMWKDALHSPEWWAYAITSFATAVATLPQKTVVSSTLTTKKISI